MENKTKKSGLKAVLIILAAALIAFVVWVNIFGGSVKFKVVKAFEDAFNRERAVTASLYEDFPLEKKADELNKDNSLTSFKAEITGIGKNDDDIFDSIFKKASAEGIILRDIENSLSETSTSLRYNDTDLITAKIYTSDEGVTVSLPDILEDSYFIGKEDNENVKIISSIPQEFFSPDREYIASLGNKAADYYLTLLKFGKYQENEDGSILFTVDEKRMDKALEFVKTLLGERLSSNEEFPIDIDSLSVKSLTSNIVMSEDGSLDSTLNCKINYALRSSPEEIKEAKFSAAFSQRDGFSLLARVDFPENEGVCINVSRKYENGEYIINTALITDNDGNSNTYSVEKKLFKEETGDKGTVSMKTLNNEGEAFEIKADYTLTEEEGKLKVLSDEAEIRKLSDDGISPYARFSFEGIKEKFEGEISIPDAVDSKDITKEIYLEIKGKLAGKLLLNSISSIFS